MKLILSSCVGSNITMVEAEKNDLVPKCKGSVENNMGNCTRVLKDVHIQTADMGHFCSSEVNTQTTPVKSYPVSTCIEFFSDALTSIENIFLCVMQ